MTTSPWHTQIETPEVPEGYTTGPPDFVGIGAQRCGTSWWFDSMRRHPDIQSAPGKELHFFDWYLDGNVNDDFVERYHSLFPRAEGKISGEWTPRYMADTWTMRMLRQAAPDAKLLVMLRDPIERYSSALDRERWLAGGQMRSRLATVSDLVWRGFYYEQLRHVFDLFPREQVLILQFEQAVRDPAPLMERTFEFLGVAPLEKPPERLGTHKKPQHERSEMPDWFRSDLAQRYREDSERLLELAPDFDLSLWKSLSRPIVPGGVPVPTASINGIPEVAEPKREIDLEALGPRATRHWLRDNGKLWRQVKKQYRTWSVRYVRNHRQHFKDTMKLVRQAANDSETMPTKVVDVGSVPGFVSGLLTGAGFEVHAVDLDPARVEPVYEQLGIKTHRADIEVQRLPFDDESVDIALLCQTLEHLRSEPMRPLREIGRILKPGGHAIISVPNVTPYMRLRFLLGDDELFGDPIGDQLKLRKVGHAADSRLYSPDQVKRMLDRAGLEIVRSKLGGGVRVRKDDEGRMHTFLNKVAAGRMQGTRYFLAVKPIPGD
jgi:SAM-dependent methyltransferase